MGNIFSSSIGRKLIMSISGLFLLLFLSLHLFLNSLLLVGPDAFNFAANFMSTNPLIKIMEPVLAAGFIIHIIYATILTLKNQAARPQNYKNVDQSKASAWSSRNMYILGFTLLLFLVMHMANFFWKIKFGEVPSVMVDGVEMHDTYTLVTSLFLTYKWINALYIAGAIALGLHLSHGFWSAFQTIGFSNEVWRKRLSCLGSALAWIIGIGFAVIAVGQYLFFQC